MNENNSPTATWVIKNPPEIPLGFRYIRIHQKCGRHSINISGFEVYGQVLSSIDIRSSKIPIEFINQNSLISISELEANRARQKPGYNHSNSTSSTITRSNKMSSHIFRRLVSMDPAIPTTNDNRAAPTTIDRILLDLSSIPTDLSTGKYKSNLENSIFVFLSFRI